MINVTQDGARNNKKPTYLIAASYVNALNQGCKGQPIYMYLPDLDPIFMLERIC